MGELSNHEKAKWNAATTGIKGLGPILNEIYEKNTKLEERITALEAELTGKSICSKIDDEIKKNQK
jgi:hypothetical protein